MGVNLPDENNTQAFPAYEYRHQPRKKAVSGFMDKGSIYIYIYIHAYTYIYIYIYIHVYMYIARAFVSAVCVCLFVLE
jgi:hypothetical protein